MTMFDRDSERQAAIAAIGRGELTQIGRLFDETKFLADELESVKALKEGKVKGAAAVNDVDVIESDAKTADIRNAVQDLQERFNMLLVSLRDGKVIGES